MLEEAMHRLMNSKIVISEPYGRPSDPHFPLALG
jgi:hypothetical protein